MKNRKGFISMSIIYSFFAVFTLVSSSLLLVYSNNLSVVKEQNREIKKDLLDKSNEAMMSFKNLIVDGGFESDSTNWKKYVDSVSDRNAILNKRFGIGNSAQHYYSGRGGLCFKGQEKGASLGAANHHNYVVNKNAFSMYDGHFYYISRVYFAWNNVNKESNQDELVLKLVRQETGINGDNVFSLFTRDASTGILNPNAGVKTFDILDAAMGYRGGTFEPSQYYNTDINKSRERIASGYCLGVNGRCAPKTALDKNSTYAIPDWIEKNSFVRENDGKKKLVGDKYVFKEGYENDTFANTLESGIFQFEGDTGLYYLLVGEQFRTETANQEQQITYCTDDYILIDLTVALQKNDFDMVADIREFTRKVDFLIDGRFFNGLKVFSGARSGLS